MVTPDECLFCKIARKESPSKMIYEDSDVVAFLDINPAAEGHALIIPKKHVENVFDISEDLLAKVNSVAKEIAARIKEHMNYSGVQILQNNGRSSGQIVDHYHIHVIPRNDNDGLVIKFPRNVGAAEKLDATARKLSSSVVIEKKEEKEEEKVVEPKKQDTKDLDLELEL